MEDYMNQFYDMFGKNINKDPKTVIEKVRSGEMHWAWGGQRGVEPCQCDKKKHHLRFS